MRAFSTVTYFAILLFISGGTPAAHSQSTKSLDVVFQELVDHHDPKASEHGDEALNVADLVATASPEDVLRTLPEIRAALNQRDNTIKIYSAYILTMISYRKDSESLLSQYVTVISPLLNEENIHLQQMGVLALGGMRPTSPPTVMPPLAALVERADRDLTAQVNALSVLLRVAPEDKRVTSALQSFLSRPLNLATKEALANGIANSRTQNAAAIDQLITFLNDDDEQVRFQAAQAFQRMPVDAVTRATPSLNERLQRKDESEEVKVAVQEALKNSRTN